MAIPLKSEEGRPAKDDGSAKRLVLAVDGKTIADAYRARIRTSPKGRAYYVKSGGRYKPIPWENIHLEVLGLFESFQELGIQKGDRIAIFSQTRPEWNISDIAILCSGAITIPIYQSNTVEDIVYVLEHSTPKLVFVDEQEQVNKIAQALKKLGWDLPVIAFEKKVTGVDGLNLSLFSDFAQYETNKSLETAFDQSVDSISPEDIASIVYTSGTTGVPKGVVLTHDNFASDIRACVTDFDLREEDCTLTFLPLAHILGRMESLFPIFSGVSLGFAENILSIPQNMVELRPTLMISVPRVFEKIYTKVLSEVQSGSFIKKRIFKWAAGIGVKVAHHWEAKKPLPLALALRHQVADRLVLSKVRKKMGGRFRIVISGGAPLSQDLCEFFHGCGIKILEGYGLTETLGPILVNRLDNYQLGTVGIPLGNGQVRIAEDGEILLKGSMVFKEYYRDPEGTKEVFTEDGWFCSGDIGEINSKGFLKITDRKKEVIVTAGGKNIPPQKLENQLKLSPFISSCMAYGDKRKFVTALITLDELTVKNWAKEQGLEYSNFQDLTQTKEVSQLIEKEIVKANSNLASFESIKKVRILPQDFTIEAGEITPSMKIKRKVITEKYFRYIDEMYRSSNGAPK